VGALAAALALHGAEGVHTHAGADIHRLAHEHGEAVDGAGAEGLLDASEGEVG
jgi:hypothetical protein